MACGADRGKRISVCAVMPGPILFRWCYQECHKTSSTFQVDVASENASPMGLDMVCCSIRLTSWVPKISTFSMNDLTVKVKVIILSFFMHCTLKVILVSYINTQ